MYIIDRYELSIPGHNRLVDARSALNHLERLIMESDAQPDPEALIQRLHTVIDALNDAADDTRPVNGQDAFERRACAMNYLFLKPEESEWLQEIRSCTEQGKQEIFRITSEIAELYQHTSAPE